MTSKSTVSEIPMEREGEVVEGIQKTLQTMGGPDIPSEDLAKLFTQLNKNPEMVQDILGLMQRTTVEMTHIGIVLDPETDKDVTRIEVSFNDVVMPGITIENNELPVPYAGKHKIVVKKFNAEGELIGTDADEITVDEDMEITEVHSLQ